MTPKPDAIGDWTDAYFNRTRGVVEKFGDCRVTYAIFMRRPVVSAPRLAIEWLETVCRERGAAVEIDLRYEEGRWVGAGEALMYVTGPLPCWSIWKPCCCRKIGPACVAAYNAAAMCMDLPNVSFLAMDARHCAGTEMAELMAYAASVGSRRAKQQGRRRRLHRQRHRRHGPLFRAGARAGHHAACADRLCRFHAARRRDVPRDLSGRKPHGPGRLFRQGGRDALEVCGRFPGFRRTGASRCGSTRRARAFARGWTRPPPTPCWSAMCRAPSRLPYRGGTARPGRPRRFGRGHLAYARTAGRGGISRRSASSPPAASARINARPWRLPRLPST